MQQTRYRRDSTESTSSLWEKVCERFPSKKQGAPFANDENNDSLDDNPTIDDDNDDEYESESDTSSPTQKSPPSLNINQKSQPWETPTKQDDLMIILNDDQNTDKIKRIIKNEFSRQGLQWTDKEEDLRPWHFGLTSIRIHFTQSQNIDISRLSFSSSMPIWMSLKKEKQQYKLNKDMCKKPNRHNLQSDFAVSLRYGALIDLNQFFYSKDHSWDNNARSKWSIFLNDQYNGSGSIEWMIEDLKKRQKKQLLISNIHHSIIVVPREEGFDIYICQKCNMNEFEAEATINNNDQNTSNGNKDFSKNFEQRASRPHSNSKPRNAVPFRHRSPSTSRGAVPLHSPQHKSRQQRRFQYEHYKRVGINGGCYFPTIQFSIHSDPFRLTNNKIQYVKNRIKQTLAILIEFFLSHRITVCYGNIDSNIGPKPYLFFQEQIPNFSSLIMKYSWQMLSSVGYRLQIQIEKENFIEKLHKLSKEKNNPDELFYRVCVYLSRIFSLKPFVNINIELQHAIIESQRKRADSAYGLISKIDIEEKNEAYIPSVSLTPTTIRIKPLKLCRTNRVLRATQEFGRALYHFVLVDIRDENGRNLQSYHFRDLHVLLLGYLENGFILMSDNRKYKYLHHSQSQLRGRQFWFYHHNDYDEDPRKRNLSFSEAYKWMGDFDKEKNPAKYAARMALCFTSTTATVQVSKNHVELGDDIEIKVNGKTLSFTDGCGTMSIELRNKIKQFLDIRNDFSVVQFRYDGAKGVVSINPDMPKHIHLFIRDSMKKFHSNHDCFEVCKLSAPRPIYLNRQAILLLSYRQISDSSFLILQQQNHLTLIRSLLRNSDAEKLILEKVPSWFLPKDIHDANIDFIHEPFFRQLLINSCLQSTRDLLQRTRIQISSNKGRNMFGIVDEYNVLKPDQVFIQYTILGRDRNNNKSKTEILDQCKVVITKNPCHHPGDIRTFIAINHPKLEHLKDVVVFSQQGDRPAPHDISGSDLDGDEYLVVWHEDLVPNKTNNSSPYDFDSQIPADNFPQSVTRDAINNTILRIAEQDCLGRLSNLHLAFADKFGVDDAKRRAEDILSTIELAGAISQEVDSGKTGYHPLSEDKISRLNNVLENKRPDFMDNPSLEQYESPYILGKLYRASKKTLPGWNRLLRYHRHLRHLQVRTRDDLEEDDDEEVRNNDEEAKIELDQSLLDVVDRQHSGYRECAHFAKTLASVYRQEIFEILNLYGLSHESDLWCRNVINGLTGELEDTAYTELEQLVNRTRTRFFNYQIIYCEKGKCHDDTPVSKLCDICRKRQQSVVVACYDVCYAGEYASEQAPILSLPWLFAAPLLQHRIDKKSPSSEGLLSKAMKKALDKLVSVQHRLRLDGWILRFQTSGKCFVGEADVDLTVCAFIEILQQCIGSKKYPHWSWIVSRFVRNTSSFVLKSEQSTPTDEWELILRSHKIDEYDEYAGLLISMDWTEEEDRVMHDYFQNILDICFDKGRQTNDIGFLNISEAVILLLQKMAINETII
ncbi:unnamed protein product [Rotaria sp. Silwood2]|nr:unnamed protein product [Rotaria sp. Silwood2]